MNQHEEKVVNGKLFERQSPNAEWVLVPYETVLGRMLLAERNLDRAISAVKAIKQTSGYFADALVRSNTEAVENF